jgi:quercetin dioxygenase-like cupin family protein
MQSRRTFIGCALCALTGFSATGADAQSAATAGVKRTILSQIDGPMDGYVTVSARIEIEPGATIARHTHPGVESSYLIEGGLTLDIDGKGSMNVTPGMAFEVPTGVIHGGKNGDTKSTLAGTYVVEKGKPLASPA